MTAAVLRAAVTGARHGGCRPTPSLPLSPSLPSFLPPLAWQPLRNPIYHLSAFPSVHAIHISLPCLMLHIFLVLWLTLRSNEISRCRFSLKNQGKKILRWCTGKKFLAMEHNFIAAK
ncbi:hypothetical protein SORBI_3002G322200 [Sorghum bicolor]|uniref:Uncharacterized protein n=1 Tax=Sorghum bicolor TaxID=4558 RepID=C5XA29_SORBI|nr:hypothetical protein SORBI_3002G322200 [Sorghum bicolor]